MLHICLICSYYRPPNNDLSSIVYLRESLETASHESISSIFILGGEFKLLMANVSHARLVAVMLTPVHPMMAQ